MINRNTLENILLKAVEADQYDAAKSCLENGAKGTAKNKDGNTALHIAVTKTDLRLFELLTEYDVDFAVLNKAGETPMEVAARNQKWEVVIAMAARKSDDNGKYLYASALLDAAKLNQLAAVQALANGKAAKDWKFVADGNNALHWASSNNNPDMVALLLAHGCKANEKNKAGLTPPELATKHGHWKCVQAFLTFNKQNSSPTSSTSSPLAKLHLLCCFNHVATKSETQGGYLAPAHRK